MIPKRLKIVGLYSYQEEVEIDFGPLLEARLFGIFGSVGSGKSSLLEAMTYAIYGDTERLGSKDSRGFNMMNLQSDRLFIEFDFEAAGKLFRSQTELKRNGKQFDKVGSPKRQAYLWSEEKWIPCEFEEVREALGGLSYTNFRRTIIIPQGKFQEFLQLGDADRTRMLEELFQLSQYEMFGPAKSLLNATNTEITEKEGRLSELSSEEMVDMEALEKELKSKEAELNQLKQQLEAKRKEKEKLALVEKAHIEREKKKKEWAKLDTQRPAMERLAKDLEKYQAIKSDMGDDLVRLDALEAEIKTLTQELDRLRDAYRSSKTASEQATQQLEKAQLTKKEAESNALVVEQLTKWTTWLKLEEEKQRVQLESARLTKELENLDLQEKSVQTETAELDKKRSATQAEIMAGERIGKLNEWKLRSDQAQEALEKLKGEEKASQEELVKAAKAAKPAAAASNERATWPLVLNERLDFLQHEEKTLKKRAEQVRLQEHLSELADQLKAGEACPLCGAEHHPEPFQPTQNDGEIVELLKQKQNELREAESAQTRLQEQLKALAERESRLQILSKELTTSKETLQKHQAAYGFEDILPLEKLDELPQLAENREALFVQLEQTEARLKKLQRDLQAQLATKEKTMRAEQELAAQLARLSGKQEAISLEEIPTEIRSQKDRRALENRKLAIQKQSANVDELLEKTEKVAKEATAAFQAVEVRGKEKKDVLQGKTDLHGTTTTRLDEQLLKTNWGSLAEVRHFVKTQAQLPQRQAELELFRSQKKQLKSRLSELDEQLKDQPFDAAAFEKMDAEIAAQNLAQERLTKGRTAIELQLKRERQNQARKKKLSEELKLLKQRADGLSTISKMMSGKGFVNYVSSVYLQEVVAAANLRFAKLTGQSLQLEVDENNRFQVRDYLNGGKLRSAKTLSGGQTFQAALCLALALAERIHSLPNAGEKEAQHFFFLDEGFGSLDEESLQTVFETLKELRKENRVVGIISHVAALQQEIPVHLVVRNDERRGSLVEMVG